MANAGHEAASPAARREAVWRAAPPLLLALAAVAWVVGGGARADEGLPATTAKPTVLKLPASIPLRREEDPGTTAAGSVLRFLVVASILAVGGAVVLRGRLRAAKPAPPGPWAAPWRRWLRSTSSSGGLRLVASTRLAPQASVHVVRWDEKEWLLGCTAAGVSVLGQRPATSATAASPAQTKTSAPLDSGERP